MVKLDESCVYLQLTGPEQVTLWMIQTSLNRWARMALYNVLKIKISSYVSVILMLMLKQCIEYEELVRKILYLTHTKL
jgi:hypothetical protein